MFSSRSYSSMKKSTRFLLYFLGAMFAMPWLGQPCLAKGKPAGTEPVMSTETNSMIDPSEEARKLKRLVKLAMDPKATEAMKKALADEIAFVERNRKLKESVVLRLLQDDDVDTDPSLPKVQLATYKDGSTRGIIFVQTDAPKSAQPARIAWVLDSKKEKRAAANR